MSDLQKSFVKAKLASLPAEPPMLFEEEEEEQDVVRDLHHDDDSSSASSASSTGTIRPSPTKHLFAKPRGSSKKSNSPLFWNEFFDQELFLNHNTSATKTTYHAYLTSPSSSGPLFVCHHGAGSSGLSFAVFASEVRHALPNAGVLSLDARGHGSTTVTHLQNPGSNEESDPTKKQVPGLDFSLETMTDDLFNVIQLTQAQMKWTKLPLIIFVGHSLGGAIVTNLAFRGTLGSSVLGFAVLDVVEGSAIDALQHMSKYLSTRPNSFPSIERAIEWHLRSRTIRDPTSARISVPSLLNDPTPPTTTATNLPLPPHPQPQSQQKYTWRTPLALTEPFWESWFTNLSKKFLSAKGAKLLILAGTDRLDKELTIGQMQGKYQLILFPDAGHFVQEDLPTRTAEALVEFFRRNDHSTLVLPPKVGDLVQKKKEERET
ncbi:MAG: Protein phosphatase methylesterase 1 [Cirrosporium novae-zelandiae]|nr:MAG: Protein phosphatase methylesterase 1 [Cirrosporium novae-zelandiae]